MMETELAQEYRKHAAAIRAAAKFEHDPRRTLVLNRIAVDYELMAHALEGIHETNRSVGRG